MYHFGAVQVDFLPANACIFMGIAFHKCVEGDKGLRGRLKILHINGSDAKCNATVSGSIFGQPVMRGIFVKY